jgi:carboxymethylenebutenolidase
MTLLEEHVDLPTAQGPMRVYVHRPSGAGKFPGLILYSEIFQQTGPIKRSALRLAGHGYVVAVPEIFHEHEPLGTVLGYDQAGSDKGNRYKYATKLSTYDEDARLVLAHLASHAACDKDRLGAVGWCLGGHLAFRAAMHPDVRATACYYATDIHTDTLGEGKKSDSLQRLKDIRGELMMVWGRQDPHIPDEGRVKILSALREAKLNFTWHEFNAVHAFMRDEGPRYDPALATIGYALALEMFERVLK